MSAPASWESPAAPGMTLRPRQALAAKPKLLCRVDCPIAACCSTWPDLLLLLLVRLCATCVPITFRSAAVGVLHNRQQVDAIAIATTLVQKTSDQRLKPVCATLRTCCCVAGNAVVRCNAILQAYFPIHACWCKRDYSSSLLPLPPPQRHRGAMVQIFTILRVPGTVPSFSLPKSQGRSNVPDCKCMTPLRCRFSTRPPPPPPPLPYPAIPMLPNLD